MMLTSGVFGSSNATFPKGSMKQGYFGRLVQHLEDKIQLLSQTNASINAVRISLFMRKTALDREVMNQLNTVQREIISLQDEANFLKEGQSAVVSNMIEGNLLREKEALQQVSGVYQANAMPTNHLQLVQSFSHEADLFRRLGILQGMVEANQHYQTVSIKYAEQSRIVISAVSAMVRTLVKQDADRVEQMVRHSLQAIISQTTPDTLPSPGLLIVPSGQPPRSTALIPSSSSGT